MQIKASVEGFGLCPARLTITFLSLANVRPVPRPVVPYGKRSFGQFLIFVPSGFGPWDRCGNGDAISIVAHNLAK